MTHAPSEALSRLVLDAPLSTVDRLVASWHDFLSEAAVRFDLDHPVGRVQFVEHIEFAIRYVPERTLRFLVVTFGGEIPVRRSDALRALVCAFGGLVRSEPSAGPPEPQASGPGRPRLVLLDGCCVHR